MIGDHYLGIENQKIPGQMLPALQQISHE